MNSVLQTDPSHFLKMCGIAFCTFFSIGGHCATGQDAEQELGDERQGFIVQVDLPLVGQRSENVKQQIDRIVKANESAAQRPIVVLHFRSRPLTNVPGNQDDGSSSRGSQFESCLFLARYLSDIPRARLVAYFSEAIEGHALLPILACEEIVAAGTASLGRATIDEPLDGLVEAAYREIAGRRELLPMPVVMTMLKTDAEAYTVSLANSPTSKVVSRSQLDEEREAGRELSTDTIWTGGALATYTGTEMRRHDWIAGTASDSIELASILGLKSTLRTSRQLPRQWKPTLVTITGELTSGRVNQIVRSLSQQIADNETNFLLVRVEPTSCRLQDATRLASFLAQQDSEAFYSVGVVSGNVAGPAGLIAIACDEAVLLTSASVGPPIEDNGNPASDTAVQRVLDDLSRTTQRPLPFMFALIDSGVDVNEYIQQESGRKAIFTDRQIAQQADANLWLVKDRVAGGEAIEPSVAVRYRLFDSVDSTESVTLGRLGVDSIPEELSSPWIDSAIQSVLAQSWLPRLLLTLGFFALMAELGNPGISVGGLLATFCFVGFFWIEGLNGNVEALEVLLFIGGLVALAVEIFVLPGFGVFGIGGLLMLLVSVVLASQTFIWPTTSSQLSEVSVNLFWVACLALGGMIGLLFMHKHLERSPLLKWVTLLPNDEDEAADLDIRETLAHRDHLLGQEGITTTRLNPSGKAQFGRDIVAVVGTGKMIRSGAAVRVVEVRGPLVLVEALG